MKKNREVVSIKSLMCVSLKGGTGKSFISAMVARYYSENSGAFLLDGDIDSPNLADLIQVDTSKLHISPDSVDIAHMDNLDFFSMGLFTKNKAVSMSGESYVQMLMDILGLAELQVGKDAVTVIDAPAGASSIFKACLRAFADTLVGAVVVITPQSWRDLDRLLKILKHYEIPVIGVVENIAFFECECGKQYNFCNGKIAEICELYGVDYMGQIPLSQEVNDVLQAGIPYIPESVEPVLNQITSKITELKPVGSGVLNKLMKKVDKQVKKNLSRILSNSILRANKEISLSNLTQKGFGGNVIELLITDKGEELQEVYMKLSDHSLKVIKNPKTINLTITAEISALMEAARGDADLEELFFLGEIEVFGEGGTVRALSFFEEIWKVMKDEMTQSIGKEMEEK